MDPINYWNVSKYLWNLCIYLPLSLACWAIAQPTDLAMSHNPARCHMAPLIPSVTRWITHQPHIFLHVGIQTAGCKKAGRIGLTGTRQRLYMVIRTLQWVCFIWSFSFVLNNNPVDERDLDRAWLWHFRVGTNVLLLCHPSLEAGCETRS